MDVLNYNDFMSDKTHVLHNDGVYDNDDTKHRETIQMMLDDENCEVVTNNSTVRIEMKNVSLMVDENGRYYFERILPKHGDVIDNFTCTSSKQVTFEHVIGGLCYSSSYVGEIIACAAHINIIVRVTFLEKPNDDDVVDISHRNLFFKNIEERKRLITQIVSTENFLYRGGCIVSKHGTQ